MAGCAYCRVIRSHDPHYKVRRASWDLGSSFPRCAWHWQFVCDRCGRTVSFHGAAWCERERQFLCVYCAPRHRKKKRSFWNWDYSYELWCELCSEYHSCLDWLEYQGKHPWQVDDRLRRTLTGLSRRKSSLPWGWVRRAPAKLQRPPLREIQSRWDRAAEIWDDKYGKYGDAYREHIFNPALFRLMGDVSGLRILDAGCGTGYFCRLLAERGARVTGVDLSRRFIEIAQGYEQREPLGIEYSRANISNLSGLDAGAFDLVVSVYVLSDTRDCGQAISEIGRVLKGKGRFVFLMAHPCFSWHCGGWKKIPEDSHRAEDHLYFRVDNYFRRQTLESQWGDFSPFLAFHRPLSEYFRWLREAGFAVVDLVEPRPLRSALRRRPRDWETEDRIPPVMIIDAVKTTS
jgi:SAM-dependent methyltransferase